MKDKNDVVTDQIIEIKGGGVDVSRIVDEIKNSIKKKKLKYIEDLKKNLPSFINTVENSEFLLDGWYENETIAGFRAKWTAGEFSFLINLGGKDTLTLGVLGFLSDVQKKPLILSLIIDHFYVGDTVVSNNGYDVISFKIPITYIDKNLLVTIKLSYVQSPMELGKGGDTRKLGIAVKQISNLSYTDVGQRYIPKLTEFEYQTNFDLVKLRYHINPEMLLPAGSRGKFFKKLILRLMRVYTSAQIAFNSYTHEYLKKISDHSIALSEYIKNIDAKLEEVQRLIGEKYKIDTVYWEKEKDDFYIFHQKYFRGEEDGIKTRLKVYTKYLPTKSSLPFIDFGCGRGEFLSLLLENNINAFGVDTNVKIVENLRKNKVNVVCDDALNYLKNYTGNICGASAFHLVEHLSFPVIFDFLYLIHAKLVKGGVVMIETPNPENLSVGSFSFYYDYSHVTKLPPLLLQKVMEYIGYKDIKIVRMHDERKYQMDSEIQKRIFGSQDYAIIGKK